MDLPKSIRIGYRDFAIEQWDSRHAVASSRYGECDKMNAVIRVDTQFGPIKAANTLLHEVMHAAWTMAGLDDSEEEERTVTSMSNVMTQVWRDNPDFVHFMSESLHGHGC